MLHGAKHRLAREHHPRSPAERAIIDAAMSILREISEVRTRDGNHALRPRATYDARRQIGLEHFGEKSENIHAHGEKQSFRRRSRSADPGLRQHPTHRVRRLSAHAQPILNPILLQHRLLLRVRAQRIETAEFFQYSTVTRNPTVHCGKPIRRPMPTTIPFHANTNCHAHTPFHSPSAAQLAARPARHPGYQARRRTETRRASIPPPQLAASRPANSIQLVSTVDFRFAGRVRCADLSFGRTVPTCQIGWHVRPQGGHGRRAGCPILATARVGDGLPGPGTILAARERPAPSGILAAGADPATYHDSRRGGDAPWSSNDFTCENGSPKKKAPLA